MDLVVDANVLFAALIKVSSSSEVFFSDKFHFYAPEFIFVELEKYKEEILAKTHRDRSDFDKVLEIFGRLIDLVPLEELTHYLGNAEKISPDIKDSSYFALAIKLNCAIWSNDAALKKQKEIPVYSTEDLLEIT